MIWQTTRYAIDLAQPKIMGIVNLTPDSFSDGGSLPSSSQALRHIERLIGEGAHIIDLGAESSRPGAARVPEQEELARLVPVLREALKLGVPISVDTTKPKVMQIALEEGADIINDIAGFGGSDGRLSSAQVVMRHGRCGLVVMHMHRDPQTMQEQTMREDEDLLHGVKAQLQLHCERLAAHDVFADGLAAQRRSTLSQRIVIDPGIGFGKTVSQNFALLARQAELLQMGFPLLVGWSRKSSLGAVTGLAQAKDRVLASVAAAVLALERGASVLRVHDVAPTVQALAVWQASAVPEFVRALE